jgi:UDP-N-acetylmuramoyl-tripeptide--D-alanyl-D-alanine ligase
MSIFDAGWVANACGGRVVGNKSVGFERFSRDSREDVRGSMFVALRGPNHDGHAFLNDVVKAGAVAVLAEDLPFRPKTVPKLAIVLVDDTLRAVTDLARAHRRRMPARVIALTGSCGKTTTKDMLRAILEREGPTLATTGNLNNHIGVPFTLLGLLPEHRFAVVELGCNHPGEITALAAIAEPDVGLITCIAAAHLEGLGSLDGVARAKGELFAALDRPGTIAVVNAEDPRVAALPTGRATPITVGGEHRQVDVRIELIGTAGERQLFVLRFPDDSTARVTLALPGRHMLMDAALAAAAAHAVGAGTRAVEEGLATVAAGEHRGEIHTSTRGVVVLDDTYNANPGSMLRALETVDALPGEGRKVAILGEMLELGDAAAELHRGIGEAAGRLGFGLLLCVGPNATRTAEGARAAGMAGEAVTVFNDVETLLGSVDGLLRSGDRVLVKGSRGMRMERVVAGVLRGPGDDL